jgi:hypothetical protein
MAQSQQACGAFVRIIIKYRYKLYTFTIGEDVKNTGATPFLCEMGMPKVCYFQVLV